MGITTRKMADARLSEWTENQAVPVVAVIAPGHPRQAHDARSAGPARGLFAGADLCARQRLSQGVEGRHRHAGQGRAAARRDRRARPRPADHAGPGRCRQRAGQCRRSPTRRWQRGQSLIKSGSVSKQDLDQRAADAANKQGLVKSAQANLDRLRVLEKYKRIIAPFDGLVTARTTDVGALINAGAGGGPALFVVSDTSKLRVYVNVPQNYVPSIKIGTKAQISVPEYPGRSFPATVEASAQSVDVGLRHDADAARRRQRRRRTDDRRFRQCAARAAAPGDRDQRAGERADFRSGRPAHRDRRCRRPRRAQAGHDLARSRHARSRSPPASPPTIGSSKARRTASRQAIRFVSPDILKYRVRPRQQRNGRGKGRRPAPTIRRAPFRHPPRIEPTHRPYASATARIARIDYREPA